MTRNFTELQSPCDESAYNDTVDMSAFVRLGESRMERGETENLSNITGSPRGVGSSDPVLDLCPGLRSWLMRIVAFRH